MSNKKSAISAHSGSNDPLEKILKTYVAEFIENNKAAKVVSDGLRVLGIGFRPLIDHITFRTFNVDERAKEFTKLGYTYDEKLGVIEYESWWAKVYRRAGYPTLFIDQAYEGHKGKDSVIPDWVHAFGDKMLHHVAITVDDIENAVFFLEKQGVPFSGGIIGDRGTDLRQIFTQPETRKGKIFTVLELAERHRGFSGFSAPAPPPVMARSSR